MPEQQKRDIIAYVKTVNSAESETPVASSWAGSVRSARVCSPGSSVWAHSIAVAVWVAAHTAKAKKS